MQLRFAAPAILLILGGCGEGGLQPFGKPEGQLGSLPPPSDNYMTAGPGADREIDYETVYGPNRGAPVADAAAAAHTPVGQTADAESSRPKIAAIAVPPVQGASEIGNAELTDALRQALSSVGWPVLHEPRQDALTISGKVHLGSPQGGLQQVEVVWTVTTADGNVVTSLRQANMVPAGSLAKSWGDTALYISDAAARGVFDLVGNLRQIRG
jgi:hypothetical protein